MKMGCGKATHESHFTRSASQGELRRGSERSLCTLPRTVPVHQVPMPGVSGASHHILKRFPRRQLSLRDSSYLDLHVSACKGEDSVSQIRLEPDLHCEHRLREIKMQALTQSAAAGFGRRRHTLG